MKEEGYVSLRDAAKEIGYEKSPGKNPYEGINNEIIREINERVDTFFKRRRTGTEFIIKEIRRFLQKKEIPNKDIETYLETLCLQIRSRQFDATKDIVYGQGDLDVETRYFISLGLKEEEVAKIFEGRSPTISTEEIREKYVITRAEMNELCEKILENNPNNTITSKTNHVTLESLIRNFLWNNREAGNFFNTGYCYIPYYKTKQTKEGKTKGIQEAKTDNGIIILARYLRIYLKEREEQMSTRKKFRQSMCATVTYPTIKRSTNYGRKPDRVRDGNGEDKLIAYDDNEKGESSEVTKD